MENETERQGGFDGEVRVLELAFPPADPRRRPRGDRVRREPERDVASLHECSVVFWPISDAISCLVLRMDSRLHVEIVPRRPSRWPAHRRPLAEWAVSAHQRPRKGGSARGVSDTAGGGGAARYTVLDRAATLVDGHTDRVPPTVTGVVEDGRRPESGQVDLMFDSLTIAR